MYIEVKVYHAVNNKMSSNTWNIYVCVCKEEYLFCQVFENRGG